MAKAKKSNGERYIWKELSLMIGLFLVIIAYLSFVIIYRQKEVIEVQSRNIDSLSGRIVNLENGEQ